MCSSIANTYRPCFGMWRRGRRSGGRSYIPSKSDHIEKKVSEDKAHYVEQSAVEAACMEQLVIQGVYPSALLKVVAGAVVVTVVSDIPTCRHTTASSCACSMSGRVLGG